MSEYDDFNKNRKIVQEREARKIEEYKIVSRERLFKACKTKITTTMIGALDIVEKEVNELTGRVDGRPTAEQIKLLDMYQRVRQKILDNGNLQIRNLEEEIKNYDIECKKYTITLPVRK